MKNCMECGYKFTFSDRLKIFFNLRGNLTCPECKSVYRDNFNFYRGLYYGLVTFISMMMSKYNKLIWILRFNKKQGD